MGEVAERAVLLADADVLIDFASTDRPLLGLVARHLGPLKVVRQVLDTVDGLSHSDCRELGIEVIELDTEMLLDAALGVGRLSFEDRLSLVACARWRWTCITNDGSLRRACEAANVETKRGLRLLLDLVRGGQLTKPRALRAALEIAKTNPRHIHAAVLADFRTELDAC